MGLTGRYNFPGIQRAAGLLIDVIIAGTGWGAWLLASPFKPVVIYLQDLLINYLANRGLILLNIGAFYVEGKFDQKSFDSAMDKGLEAAKVPGLSNEQKRKIDAGVKEAFRHFARINVNDSVPNVPGS